MNREIPWWRPEMTGRELALVIDVIASNYLNEGEVTERFESAIAARCGAQFAVATTSGTTAIFLALVALGVGPGDEVIVPDLTFIATANAVTLAGATTVLADIDPRTLAIAPAAFEAAVTQRTKAVIPVHVSGRGADMSAILAIARRRGLVVVEDAAEAFVSSQSGKALGTLGDAGCLSFSPNKSITTGQGGAVITDDPAVHRRLRELKDQGRPLRGTGGDDEHPSVGFNFKLTNLQAAVGLAQLEVLEERLERQRRIHTGYVTGLDGVRGIELPGFNIAAGETPLWTDALVRGRRDELDAHLAARRMGCRRFWHPLHSQAPYRRPPEEFPEATRASADALWLPSAFTLTDADVSTVCAEITGFFGRD